MVNFALGLVCKLPLESQDKLANPNFPIPVGFIYGDNDWVTNCELDAPQRVAEANPDKAKSHALICPGAGHNLHMDNPIGLSNMIINELLGENRPVTAPTEAGEDFQDNFMGEVDEMAQDTENIPENNQEEEEAEEVDQKL